MSGEIFEFTSAHRTGPGSTVIVRRHGHMVSVAPDATNSELRDAIVRLGLALLASTPVNGERVPMLLTCPLCGERHIDEGEFATQPHHTHACQHCGMCWRPAVVATVGVRFLPGFKNEESKPEVNL